MSTNAAIVEAVGAPEGPASLMPRLGEIIRVPGLDDFGIVAPEKLDISDFGCHDSNVSSPCAPQESNSTGEHESALIDAIITPLAPMNSVEMEAQSDSVAQEFDLEEQHPEGFELAEQAANNESQRQSVIFHEHKYIHHFNFFGYGMPCKNATPPAVSLFVIARGAKAGFAQCEALPHRYAVLWNAAMQIDPVIYHGPADQLDLRGERLREAVTGTCEKFYSEHGTWRHDQYGEEDDRPSPDSMEVREYLVESLPVNGWFQSEYVMSHNDFFTKSSALADREESLKKETRGYGHKKEWQPKQSPLSQMVMVEDLDDAEEKDTETTKATVSLDSHNATKKFESNWTVDLDKYLGKCDNWADEVDDDDEHVPDETSACCLEDCSSAAVQPDVVDEPEAGQELEKNSTSGQSSNGTIPDSLPGLTASDTSFFDEDSEDDDIPSPPSTSHPEVMHDLINPSHADAEEVEKFENGLTDEELQAEDEEVYGKASILSPDVSLVLQNLRNSGLITSRHEPFSDSESSDEDEDENTSSRTSSLGLNFLGGTFSLPIRQKPRASVEIPQKLSTTSSQADSSQIASSSFALPSRVKSPISTKVSEDSALSLYIYSDVGKDIDTRSSENEADSDLIVRPAAPKPWHNFLSRQEEDDTESAPRRPHKRRLTGSVSELVRTSLEAWPEVDESDSGEGSISKQANGSSAIAEKVFEPDVLSPEEMLKRFNDAEQGPSLQRPRISRSLSFPNLALQKAGEAAKARRFPRRRHSSLRSRKTVDKPDAIVEQEEWATSTEMMPKESAMSETVSPVKIDNNSGEDMSDKLWRDMAKSSGRDEKKNEVVVEVENNFPLVMPLACPYKRPESNTPLKMRGKAIGLNLPENSGSDGFAEDNKPQTRLLDNSRPTRSSSEPFVYALNNWSNIFKSDNINPNAAVPTTIILDDTPFLEFPLPLSPPSTIDTASDATSPLLSPIELESSSTSPPSSDHNTDSSSAEPARIVKDVKFIRTRPARTTWGRIKEKLGSTGPVAKVKQELKLSHQPPRESSAVDEAKSESEIGAKKKAKSKDARKSVRKSLKMGFVECFVGRGAFEGD